MGSARGATVRQRVGPRGSRREARAQPRPAAGRRALDPESVFLGLEQRVPLVRSSAESRARRVPRARRTDSRGRAWERLGREPDADVTQSCDEVVHGRKAGDWKLLQGLGRGSQHERLCVEAVDPTLRSSAGSCRRRAAAGMSIAPAWSASRRPRRRGCSRRSTRRREIRPRVVLERTVRAVSSAVGCRIVLSIATERLSVALQELPAVVHRQRVRRPDVAPVVRRQRSNTRAQAARPDCRRRRPRRRRTSAAQALRGKPRRSGRSAWARAR